jgi:hypothetical protein
MVEIPLTSPTPHSAAISAPARKIMFGTQRYRQPCFSVTGHCARPLRHDVNCVRGFSPKPSGQDKLLSILTVRQWQRMALNLH